MIQFNWRMCKKCALFVFSGSPESCPFGGAHDHTGMHFHVRVNDLTAANNPSISQGWKWCNKCQGLVAGDSSEMICAASGAHDHTSSGEYSVDLWLGPPKVPFGHFALPSTHDWRWCTKCLCLFNGDVAGHCSVTGSRTQPNIMHESALKDDGEPMDFRIFTDFEFVRPPF